MSELYRKTVSPRIIVLDHTARPLYPRTVAKRECSAPREDHGHAQAALGSIGERDSATMALDDVAGDG